MWFLDFFKNDSLRRVKSKAEHEGAIDGQKGIPHVSSDAVSPWERALASHYRNSIEEIGAELNRDLAPLNAEYDLRKNVHAQAKAAYDAKYNELKRPVLLRYSPWQAWGLILVVSVMEIPINKIIFEAVTGEATWLAWLLAIGFAWLLGYLAHRFGGDMRQGLLSKGRLATYTVTGACILGALTAFAYVRVYVMGEPLAGGAMITEWLQHHMGLASVAVLFFLMNTLFVIFAGWVGFHSHDSDHEYEERFKEYEDSMENLQKIEGKWKVARAQHVGQAMSLVHTAQELISHYRKENLRARQDGQQPAVWENKTPDGLISKQEFPFLVKYQNEEDGKQDEKPGGGGGAKR